MTELGFDPHDEYAATVESLRQFCAGHADQAADLGNGRRLYATYLPPFAEYGGEEGDSSLLLTVGATQRPDIEEYTLRLARIDQGGRTGLHATVRARYVASAVMNHALRDPREDYEDEDWRHRLAAVVGCDVFEAWFRVANNDPSPKVQAALAGDRYTQDKLKLWRRQGLGG